ncbi:integrase [Alcaligenaceae bacterium B3P038]|nr:integrase [Alcaligenaceae bacterium B3P038]
MVTYYFYDRRASGESDIPLGRDYEKAIVQWAEVHNNAPRVVGTIEQAFQAWEADKESGLLSYTNHYTSRGYRNQLARFRPLFGPVTWESISFSHLVTYLDRRSAKTQGNREMALFSVIWNYARKKGITDLPWPAAGMERSRWKNTERAREFQVTDDLFDAVYFAGDQVLQDCMDLASATGMRLNDTITVLLPAGDLLRMKANKTGKKADFDISLSHVLPDLVRRRRSLKADHLMLLSTPTGRPVTLRMLRDRYDYARIVAAHNAECAGEHELAADIKSMILRDMRKRASDLSESDEAASQLLQHTSVNLTKKHYRSTVVKLKPVR